MRRDGVVSRRWSVVEALDAIEAALAASAPAVQLDAPAGDPFSVQAAIMALDIAFDGRAVSYSLASERNRIVAHVILRGRAALVPLTLGFSDAAR